MTLDPVSRLVTLPPRDLSTHALVIGATGSGKTNLLHHLLAQDVLLGHSIVVLDARGDLVAGTLEICAGRADFRNACVLDLRDRDGSCGFDPLAGSGDPYFRALGVLDAVEANAPSWGPQLAETLRNALVLLAQNGEPLTRLEELLYEPRLLACLVASCGGESVRAFWERYAELSADRQAALASPVLNKVSLLLATPAIRALLARRDPLDLAAQLDAPGSVTLVSLAADETHGAGRMLGRVLLSALRREIFARVGIPESRRNPVRIYVDEFENFGEEDFEEFLAEGRRFAASIILAHQTLAQLSARTRSMVLNNVGAKVAFRCGREDAATISKDLTGDPKALDLASLGTGEAVLWTKRAGAVAIETNAPIVGKSGGPSPEAEAFEGLARYWREPAPAPEPEPTATVEASPARPGPTLVRSREDWLCG